MPFSLERRAKKLEQRRKTFDILRWALLMSLLPHPVSQGPLTEVTKQQTDLCRGEKITQGGCKVWAINAIRPAQQGIGC